MEYPLFLKADSLKQRLDKITLSNHANVIPSKTNMFDIHVPCWV